MKLFSNWIAPFVFGAVLYLAVPSLAFWRFLVIVTAAWLWHLIGYIEGSLVEKQ